MVSPHYIPDPPAHLVLLQTVGSVLQHWWSSCSLKAVYNTYGPVPLSSAGGNLIVVQISSNTIKQQAALQTLMLLREAASYSIPNLVLWTCRIAFERSVQGSQSTPTRSQPSNSFHRNCSEGTYSIDLTEINQDRQTQVSGARPLTSGSDFTRTSTSLTQVYTRHPGRLSGFRAPTSG